MIATLDHMGPYIEFCASSQWWLIMEVTLQGNLAYEANDVGQKVPTCYF